MSDPAQPASSPSIVDTTPETFQRDVLERSAEVPVVVDFWAPWCGPCRLLGPLLETAAVEADGKFLLVRANTEEVPQAAAQFGVSAIPAVFAVKGGEIVDFFTGLLPEPQLRSWLERLQPTEAETLLAEARAVEDDDPETAKAKYRRAAELAPAQSAAPIALARLHLKLGESDAAQELLDALERRGFLEPEAEALKAQLEVRQQGQAAGSVEACRAEVAADPNDRSRQWKLAESLAAAGQYEQALQIALELIQAEPANYREPGRQLMVDIFRLLPDDSPLTGDYRRRLSTALY